MAIIRPPMQATQFTQVPNHWTRDPRLSLKALGLLVYITSHAESYNLTVRQIIAQKPDGECGIRSTTKELEKLGYLVRHRERKNGRWMQYDYQIVEYPQVATTMDLPAWSSQSGEVTPGKSRVGSGVLRTPPENTSKEDHPDHTIPSISPVPAAASIATGERKKDRERETLDLEDRNEFPDLPHRLLGKLKYREKAWRDYIIGEISNEHEPYGNGWWIAAEKNGTLEDLAAEIKRDWLAANRK